MLRAKKRATLSARPQDKAKQQAVPSLEELLAARDWVGAITLLTHRRRGPAARGDVKLAEWLAYAHFHNGEHDKALTLYQELLRGDDPDPLHHTYSAACHYYLGDYDQAEAAAHAGPRCALATRILFHCAAQRGDDGALLACHAALSSSLEDQLSLAALHFERGHYQEATELYKSLLLEHRELLALNVYVAACYSKLDYYDVAQDVLQAYLAAVPSSPLGLNLKACNAFRLQDGKAAEAELRPLLGDAAGGGGGVLQQPAASAAAAAAVVARHELIRHNLVVFRGGEGAMQVLPALGDAPPEARLNLAIHHLRRGELPAAAALLEGVSPSTPHEFILKAIVALCQGQAAGGSPEQLQAAREWFRAVGSSPAECDTIPGRQAMASCFFLLRQWEDVLVFLNSIRSYFASDDAFNWNYGLALAAAGQYRDAADALGAIASEALQADPVVVCWRARCLIATGRPAAAWALYSAARDAGSAAACGEDGYRLLACIANDAYRTGAFHVAAKAFDVLERLDPSPAMYEAKRGACAGTFQRIVAGKEQPELLGEVLELLRGSASASGGGAGGSTALQVEQLCAVMRNWGQRHGVVA